MRALIYTAIFGSYDVLKQPSPQDEPCDFICFTDSEMPARVGAWRVIHVRRNPEIHPRMQAKRFKLLSHEILPHGRLSARYAPLSIRRRVDMSIWIDASLQIKCSTFVRDMRDILADGDWAMFAHPWRDCIYEEADACATMAKYQGLPLALQVESYRPIVPAHGSLYAGGVIVRREPCERLKRVQEAWWGENVSWTFQDQLSLPYVLRKLAGPEPRRIPGHLLSNNWFDFIPHNSDM